MDTLPFEITAAICCEIQSPIDLANFRLVNRTCAAAARPLQARHIAVLNTSEHLQELVRFLESNPKFAWYTNSLSIYHATWPICTRDKWETHPLLLGGNDRMGVNWERARHGANRAYSNYRSFIMSEAQRNPVSDQLMIFSIFQLLPRLAKVKLGHVQTWSWGRSSNPKYTDLQHKIWMSALYKDSIGPMLGIILPTLNTFPSIKELDILGTLDPTDSAPLSGVKADYIEQLRTDSLLVFASSQQPALDLLQRFPNVKRLSLSLASSGWNTAVLLHELTWPQLCDLELSNIWVTDHHLNRFFERHIWLRRVKIQDITLVSGTWHSVFENIKANRSNLQLQADGFIHSLSDALFINMGSNFEQRYLMFRYLQEPNFPWPFTSST